MPTIHNIFPDKLCARPIRSHFRRALIYAGILCAVALGAFLATAPHALAGGKRYVALGDSFASGHGTRIYYDETCMRSVYSYPFLLMRRFGLQGDFHLAACSGAKVEDVLRDQLGALGSNTEYVSLSVGGNDLGDAKWPRGGMGMLFATCASSVRNCKRQISAAEGFAKTVVPGRMDKLLWRIGLEAPNAIVGIILYPWLMPGSKPLGQCGVLKLPVPFGSNKPANVQLRIDANLLVSALNRELTSAAERMNRFVGSRFVAVETQRSFAGREVCGRPEFINGMSNPLKESMHPNRAGHRDGFVRAIVEELSRRQLLP